MSLPDDVTHPAEASTSTASYCRVPDIPRPLNRPIFHRCRFRERGKEVVKLGARIQPLAINYKRSEISARCQS